MFICAAFPEVRRNQTKSEQQTVIGLLYYYGEIDWGKALCKRSVGRLERLSGLGFFFFLFLVCLIVVKIHNIDQIMAEVVTITEKNLRLIIK